MVTGSESRRGPFEGDYPDPRSAEEVAADKRSVCRQVRALVKQQQADDAFRRELLIALQRRRAQREDLVQFDILPARGGPETLIVRGELLLTRESFDDAAVERFLRQHRFERWPTDCLHERVVRLGNPDIEAPRLDDIARFLREQGISAAANHIAPLGPVAKGQGGPEPSAGAVKFPPELLGSFGGTEPVPVAVIDTGISAEIRSDGWLVDVVRNDNIDLLDDIPSPDRLLDFGAGHGTFAAGVVQQVAPAADIRAYKAMDSDGIGSEFQVACAMLRAVDEGARILNLSLGAQTLNDQPLLAVEAALDEIEQRDPEALVIAAAGNYGSTRPCWPAASRRVVSVAGLTAELAPSDWSSRGFWVDCSTIGEGVLSTYVEGEESPELDPRPDSFPANAWAVWIGTSFAAPQIAGAVARLCQSDGLAPRRALQQLLRSGTRIPDFGRAVEILPGT